MTRDDVVDLLTAIAAVDKRTIGDADVIVWYEIVGDLDRDRAMQAARDHFRESDEYLMPKHIVDRVRAGIRDELDRESDEEREARQDRLAFKVLEDADMLAAAKTIPGEPKYKRPEHRPDDPKRVKCSFCNASVGNPCIAQSTGRPMRIPVPGTDGMCFHPSRIDDAKKQAAST